MTLIDQWEASFRKGFAKPMILQILSEEDSYPYKLTKQVSQKSMGMLTIATSNIYPILKNLKDEGLIIEKGDNDRKVMYGLTNEGVTFLHTISESITNFLSIINNNFKKQGGHENNEQ